MQLQTIVSVLLVIFIISALISGARKRTTKRDSLAPLASLSNITKRSPLTDREREMYFALCSALPECVVLAQVALSALITTDSQSTRNRFDRKVADFVICSKKLTVVAIIELDDSTHEKKKIQDNDRDAMLRNAGYYTLRFRTIPNAESIREEISTVLTNATDLA